MSFSLLFFSQQLEQLPHQQQHDRPLCLFCEEYRKNRLQCEMEMVMSTKVYPENWKPTQEKINSWLLGKVKMSGYSQPYSSISEESFKSYNPFMPLTNGYCKVRIGQWWPKNTYKDLNLFSQDTANILGAENLDLLSPLIALEHREAFPVVRAFLSHIFTQFKMVRVKEDL